MRTVRASSFADPRDIAAFRACKARGNSDRHCFSKGDNGIGFCGDDMTNEKIPWCALPRDEWQSRWGAKSNARLRRVLVVCDGIEYELRLGDTMPSYASITNGRGIDLAPGSLKLMNLSAPLDKVMTWRWADDDPEVAAEGWFSRLLRIFRSR